MNYIIKAGTVDSLNNCTCLLSLSYFILVWLFERKRNSPVNVC